MQAIILAAGMGTRIKDHFDMPKGFIHLTDEPIILSSIKKLRQYGIYDILIITGHMQHYYQELSANNNDIRLIFNRYFDKYSSLYSLYCAKDFIKDDFLLLESDIVYESKAIAEIINFQSKDCILVSGKTNAGDEVYVEACNNKLIKMSKDIGKLEIDKIIGEFVGISKLSKYSFANFIKFLENNPDILKQGHYEEDGLVKFSCELSPIQCLKIEKLSWCEIDNIEQFQKAKVMQHELI